MENKNLICEELAKVLQLTRNQDDLEALRYDMLENLGGNRDRSI